MLYCPAYRREDPPTLTYDDVTPEQAQSFVADCAAYKMLPLTDFFPPDYCREVVAAYVDDLIRMYQGETPYCFAMMTEWESAGLVGLYANPMFPDRRLDEDIRRCWGRWLVECERVFGVRVVGDWREPGIP